MHFGDQCSGAILLRVNLSWGKLHTIEMVTWDHWDLGQSYIGWLMIDVLDIFPLKTWTRSLFRFQEIMIMNHILPNLPSIIHLVNKICGRCVKQDLSSCKGTNLEMWVSRRYVDTCAHSDSDASNRIRKPFSDRQCISKSCSTMEAKTQAGSNSVPSKYVWLDYLPLGGWKSWSKYLDKISEMYTSVMQWSLGYFVSGSRFAKHWWPNR